MKKLVKICRIKDLSTARLCGEIGVDFIGIHALQGFGRHQEEIKSIFQEMKMYFPDTKPVMLTKITDKFVIEHMLRIVPFDYLQFHSELSVNTLSDITNHLTNCFGNKLTYLTLISSERSYSSEELYELGKFTDFFLIDKSHIGGEGKEVSSEFVLDVKEKLNGKPFFLAGGLDVKNVASKISNFNPNGVDVQSSLEMKDVDRRPKDPKLLFEFMSNVKRKPINLLSPHQIKSVKISLALTEFSVKENEVPEYLKSLDIDRVHLDFSDGSLAPKFIVSPYDKLKLLRKIAPCLPINLHLFLEDLEKIKTIIEKSILENPLLDVIHLHVPSPNKFTSSFIAELANYINTKNLRLGLSVQSTGFTSESLKHFLNSLKVYVTEFSLITHSKRRSSIEVQEKDIPKASLIRKWIDKNNYPADLGIDRDISLDKIRLFKNIIINQVIVGKDLINLSYDDMRYRISNYRGYLNNQELNT